jgi:phosphoglycerate dehydrogenase-like enzyme
MPAFTLLCTANAFRESGESAERPVIEAGGEIVYSAQAGPLPPPVLVDYLRQVDAVVAAGDPYTAEVLDHCPRLKAIVRWGTGYDTVDLAECTERGILACNAPGQNVEAVADYTLAVMLGVARHLPRQIAVMRSGGWEEIRGVELYRKTVGIVGFGAIGRGVARRVRGFDCRILAYDPLAQPEAFGALGAERVELPELFREADFVTLHAALTPHNRGMISAELLSLMKPGAFFINAARGPLVDEPALTEALREGRIAGAALDAFATEPLPAEHPLRHLPNCLTTPHSAFNTVEAADATNRVVIEGVLAVLRGERPKYLLNPEVLESPLCRNRNPLL